MIGGETAIVLVETGVGVPDAGCSSFVVSAVSFTSTIAAAALVFVDGKGMLGAVHGLGVDSSTGPSLNLGRNALTKRGLHEK